MILLKKNSSFGCKSTSFLTIKQELSGIIFANLLVFLILYA